MHRPGKTTKRKNRTLAFSALALAALLAMAPAQAQVVGEGTAQAGLETVGTVAGSATGAANAHLEPLCADAASQAEGAAGVVNDLGSVAGEAGLSQSAKACVETPELPPTQVPDVELPCEASAQAETKLSLLDRVKSFFGFEGDATCAVEGGEVRADASAEANAEAEGKADLSLLDRFLIAIGLKADTKEASGDVAAQAEGVEANASAQASVDVTPPELPDLPEIPETPELPQPEANAEAAGQAGGHIGGPLPADAVGEATGSLGLR